MTNIVPASVLVARACPVGDLPSLEEDVEGRDGSSGRVRFLAVTCRGLFNRTTQWCFEPH